MGQLTVSQIISEGLLQAGNTSMPTRAGVWLRAWLRSTYAGWPWPFLYRNVTIDLPKSSQFCIVGAGYPVSTPVAPAIKRVLDPAWVYTSDYKDRGRVRIRQIVDADVDTNEFINNPATNVGRPSLIRARDFSLMPTIKSTPWGAWWLYPWPIPDKDYKLVIDFIEQPDDPADADKPLYPNDRTMMQAVCVEAWKHADPERYGEGLSVLASMVQEDRVKFGEVHGTNDVIGLDPHTFK